MSSASLESHRPDPDALRRANADATAVVRSAGAQSGQRFAIGEQALIQTAGAMIAEVRSSGRAHGERLEKQAGTLTEISRSLKSVQGAIDKPQLSAVTLAVRTVTCLLSAWLDGDAGREGRNIGAVAERYARSLYASTNVILRSVHEVYERAASEPASTTGWGSVWSQARNADLLYGLAPQSIYSRLAARGLRLDLSGVSSVRLPTRVSGSLAGAFVAEGMPIPVGSLVLGLNPIGPVRKVGIISVYSNELSERSTPSIESIVRATMSSDSGELIDSYLLDSNAGDAERPPGLLFGVTPIAATAGGGAGALAGDLSALAAAIPNAADLIFIMTESERLRAMSMAPGLLGTPILVGPVEAGQVIALDAADFVSVAGDGVRFDISDQASVHLSDDPLPLVSGAVLGSPAVQLWQLDLVGLRMLLFLTWGLRRPNRIAVVESVTW